MDLNDLSGINLDFFQRDNLNKIWEEARQKEIDYYTLVAAKELSIEPEAVTKDQRDRIKVLMFTHTYGGG